MTTQTIERVQVLIGHTSPDTAYVIDDYPASFTLRCKKRVWVERAVKGAKKGQFRQVYQTTNPRKPGEVWNKPHPGQYYMIVALYLDSEEHVQWWGTDVHLSPVGHARARMMGIVDQLPESDRKIYNVLLAYSKKYATQWDEWEADIGAIVGYMREHDGQAPELTGSVVTIGGRAVYLRESPEVYLAEARERLNGEQS